MTTDQLRARIQAACDAAIAKGWRIVKGDWIRRGATNCCCPLGAVVLDCDPGARQNGWAGDDEVFDISADALEVDNEWINNFTAAFDGWEGSRGREDAHALGREFRAKYKEA